MGRCGQERCLGSWIKLSVLTADRGREWFIIISITWIRHPSFSAEGEGEESPQGHPYTPIPSHLLLLSPRVIFHPSLSHSNRLRIRRFPHVQIRINNSCSLQKHRNAYKWAKCTEIIWTFSPAAIKLKTLWFANTCMINYPKKTNTLYISRKPLI